MCGRIHRFTDVGDIARIFAADVPEGLNPGPDYNGSPYSWQLIIRLDKDGKREIANMRWGLVPREALSDQLPYPTFNAKSDTILEKRSFEESARHRRCLVPVDGYYEWDKYVKGKKVAYALSMKDKSPFCLAGIWSWWMRDGKVLETFAVVTCEPNPEFEKFHPRMPVILHPEDYDRWLQVGDTEYPPLDLCKPFPAERMHVWRVNPEVGDIKKNHRGLLDPYVEPPQEPEPPRPEKKRKTKPPAVNPDQGLLF
ncbi:SOS response-associated peptidase [Acidicapsa dinghuensis]|uniref:Abasic site processing protein n=1 Tax=Acidicapsa dinghuensis TaxID=2218256 RepID=A0ABW1ECL3_9BACT|nr:SOS response-associated peptidase [Acidicapsa dinghuensis]